ncbi:hypothetical protein HMPREF0044_0461 [Gleimia coleocanis DSM 15436]|uniref:Toxin-antitoxin system, toxin component n=1 Tax=Gleimia coleocanis DSM 15436 TaxID=525245 RepID=C0VZ71_9ACTO|nr:DUF2505 domain-containing protein [Gleimia coleocanis]EEH64724.1 hypothetical protein HMPREF0044_0461 [Gleimia coleocanis DSM 15436]
MKTSFEIAYPASLEKVWEVLSTPEFLTTRVTDQAQLDCAASVNETDRGFVASTNVQADPAELKLPPIAKKFIPEAGIKVQVREDWDRTAGTSTLEVDAGGLPVSVSGFSRLVSEGAQTKRITEVEVKVSIPLFGKKIEQVAVENIESLITAETQTFKKFI